jgi:hypothetical protein
MTTEINALVKYMIAAKTISIAVSIAIPRAEVRASKRNLRSSARCMCEFDSDLMSEGFGGLEVDDQLEARRLLDHQIAGLCAFQDLVDIADRGALFPLGPDNRWTY